jgi:hypothetical protein
MNITLTRERVENSAAWVASSKDPDLLAQGRTEWEALENFLCVFKAHLYLKTKAEHESKPRKKPFGL